MAVKLKCGSTFSSISWISLLRLPRISLSLAMSSTTSSVTFFTSTSGVNSWPCALPNRRAAKRHQAALAIVRMLYNPQIINARGRLHVDGRFETALFSNAFLARRLSIIDQAPAALQVGVALEYVLVERRLLQDAARVEQIGAHADQAQRDRGIAQPDRPEIADRIGIDVGRGADAVAQRARAQNRQHAISRRHRPGDRRVDGLVELVHAAVESFERIAWIAVRGGACRQKRKQHCAGWEPHFAGSLAGSAALLNRNWLMRFSSTTADWVRRRRSPFFSITPSPPASSPMYCSPRIPEVRILAVVSRGNW